MHTVEMLEAAVNAAQSLGYKIRQEWMGGVGGGACEFAGQKWIFIDLALNTAEQLDQVLTALAEEPAMQTVRLPEQVEAMLPARRAA